MARATDRKTARELLRRSALPLDGLEKTELWCLVDESDAPIGFAGLEILEDQGLLRSVVVREKRRNTGAGAMLVRHVLHEARSRSLSELFLITETAQRFFEKFGFRAFERSKVKGKVLESVEFTQACSETAPVMHLDLS